MAAGRKSRSADAGEATPNAEAPLHRLTNIIALLCIKGEDQPDQIRILAAAGFRNNEIASLLGLTSNAVTVALHRIRKKR